MPKRTPAPPATGPDRLQKDLLAIAFMTLGAFLLAALIFSAQGYEGWVTRALARGLTLALGVGAYGVPVVAVCLALFYGLEHPPVTPTRALIGLGLLLVVILAAVHLQTPEPAKQATHGLKQFGYLFAEPALLRGGGYLGAAVACLLLGTVGPLGGIILLCGLGAAALILITQGTLPLMVGWVGRTAGRGLRAASSGVNRLHERRRQPPGPRTPTGNRPRRGQGAALRGPIVDLDNDEDDRPGSAESATKPPAPVPERKSEPRARAVRTPEPVEDTDVPTVPDKPSPEPPATDARPTASRSAATRRGKAQQPALLDEDALYQLPSTALLTAYADEGETEEDRELAAENIIKLEDTLASFGINAKVSAYERGPVLTRYEVELERGTRVSQVPRHTDDIRLALAAWDVRIEAPIPGKAAIGIEVPNQKKTTVGLRSIVESAEFRDAASPLLSALGRDIAGHPVFADLSHMPHLLIAGATNSGKSVCLHSIIVSLLMRARPQEVQLIMVDPKRVELNLYEGIPHLMSPVVNTVQQAADVLRKAIREMEKRYDKFAKVSAANITEYNFFTAGARLVAGKQTTTMEELQRKFKLDDSQAKRLMDMLEWGGVVLENLEPETEPWRVVIGQDDERTVPLSRVVIIIDELADLMMQARAEFEFSISRIAQLARATGLHLVVATQRPSVKVVTGNLKANIPSRIALSVASQVDSRTILDGVGAERLIGRGDMLYAPIDASKPRRVQGAYVSRAEIEAVAEFCRKQGDPNYTIIPEVPEEEETGGGDAGPTDGLYADAVRYVVNEGEASVSMIQRRFKVGYARAGRLIDMMAQRGVVGPSQGSKPREVLIGANYVEVAIGGKPPQLDLLPEAEDDLPALPPPDPNVPEHLESLRVDGTDEE